MKTEVHPEMMATVTGAVSEGEEASGAEEASEVVDTGEEVAGRDKFVNGINLARRSNMRYHLVY